MKNLLKSAAGEWWSSFIFLAKVLQKIKVFTKLPETGCNFLKSINK